MRALIPALVGWLWAVPAGAHFLQLLPSVDVLPDGGSVEVDIRFGHPMDGGPLMDMARPRRVGVVTADGITDLDGALRPVVVDGMRTWQLDLALPEPGGAMLFVEPAPYWEPAEGKMIVHYTKTFVDSFATGEGWAAPLGLPVEIQPLARPTGLWTGNVFRGVVLHDGAPVPFAEVEVEYLNDGSVTAPNDAFVTQVILADANGTFGYAMPRAGWWGFAALIDGPTPMTSPEGTQVPVELGGVLWVRAVDMGG